MTTVYFAYVITEVFLLAYTFSILLKLNMSLGSENEIRLLKCIIFTFFGVVLTDIIWAMVEDHVITPSHTLNAAINAVSISSVTLGCYFWYCFVQYRLHSERAEDKRFKRLSSIPMVVAVSLNFISIFTEWVFYIDAEGHYSYGPLFLVQAVCCYIYLVIPTIISLALAFKTRSRIQRQEYLIYASYILPSLIAGLTEDYVPTVPVLYLCMFMMIHVLFLTIQDGQIYNDALTGLSNRRRLDQYLEDRLAAASEKHPVSVFMMDMDHFKSINDTYGHIGGDRALKAVGETLQRITANKASLAARYGGDEFCVVFDGAAYSEDDIDALVNDTLNDIPRSSLLAGCVLSISVGGMTYTAPQPDYTSAIRQVDERLYQNKRSKQKTHRSA